MNMTTIKVQCTDQTLTVERNPALTTGGVSVDRVAFTFCPLWNGYQKTAVFYRSTDQVFHVLLDADDTALVPQEVLRSPGFLYFGVFGVKGSSVRPSEILRYTVRGGAISDSTAVPDPTPDIYAQLSGAIGNLADLETSDRSSLVAAINELRKTGGQGTDVAHGIPPGGKAGQVLMKRSDDDYAVEWADITIPKEYGLITYDQDRAITIT